MRKILYILLLSFFSISCEKVVELNLDADAGRIVIDATLSAPEGKCKVIISTTVDYYEKVEKKFISNAEIKITNLKTNKFYSIPYIKNGEYESKVEVEYNSQYQIEVKIEGIIYKGINYLGDPIEIDEIGIEIENEDNEVQFKPYCSFMDIPNQNNYYRAVLYKNENRLSNLYFLEDDNKDKKNKMKMNLYNRRGRNDDDENSEINSGDKVTIELLSLNKVTYEYYKALQKVNIINGNESDAPGNPVSNLSNNVLGYFAVYYSSKKEIIAQ